MRDKVKTPLQQIIDGDMQTDDGVYYAKLAESTTLAGLFDIMSKAENTLYRKANEARKRGDVPDCDKLHSDRYTFSQALQTLRMQHG